MLASNENFPIGRVIWLLVCMLVGWLVGFGLGFGPWWGMFGGVALGFFTLLIDAFMKKVTIGKFTAGIFGLMVGLFCAVLISKMGLFNLLVAADSSSATELRNLISVSLAMLLGYIGMSLALRSNREEFSVIIPYVRFRRESIHGEPIILDTETISDGRLKKVFDSGFIKGPFLVPSFVLDSLQTMAKSTDSIERARGQRALDHLTEWRDDDQMDISIVNDTSDEDSDIDNRIISLARRDNARILTGNKNTARLARLQKISTISLHELRDALRPSVEPGQHIDLFLLKKGRDEEQAIGYLSDGTMIVVNHAEPLIGTTARVIVSGAMTTSAGQLIFAELEGGAEN